MPEYDGFSYEGVLFKQCGDKKCIGCGACSKICPQKAICAENPCQTNEERCIVRVDFEKLCAEYGTPKTFYVQETVL